MDLKPFTYENNITRCTLAGSGLTEDLYYGSEETIEATHCYFTTKIPDVLDWTQDYTQDIATSAMINGFKQHTGNTWIPTKMNQIHKSFHPYLRRKEIQFLNGKLFLFKPVFEKVRYIGLTIVPCAMQRCLFSHYYCGPTGDHMGEYKTLF